MIDRLRRFVFETLHPDIYHGRLARRPFFEGWYFKLIDGAARSAWAVIPGIYRDVDAALDSAFVMVLDRTHDVVYHAYPVEAFAAAQRSFLIRVGPNTFCDSFMTLNLPALQGHITFAGARPWPVSWRAPGIMGWYAWFPMECYHGVVSLDHRLDGELRSGEERISFDGGRGYIEKDWGRNFPQTWIWVQANHFPGREASLTASVARIPFYGRVFPGFIIGFLLDGRLYRFATYLGSTLEEVRLDGGRVRIAVRGGGYELRITAVRGDAALLYAPTPGQGMTPRVRESINAAVQVTLRDKGGQILFEGESAFGGVEIEGDTGILVTA